MIPIPRDLLPKISSYHSLPNYASAQSKVELMTDYLVQTKLYFHWIKRTGPLDQNRVSTEVSSAAQNIVRVFREKVSGTSKEDSSTPKKIHQNVARFLLTLEEGTLPKEGVTAAFNSLDQESQNFLIHYFSKVCGIDEIDAKNEIQTDPYVILNIQNDNNENILEVLLQRLEQKASIFAELEKLQSSSHLDPQDLKALLEKSPCFELLSWYVWYLDGGKDNETFGELNYGSNRLRENPKILFEGSHSLIQRMKESFASLKRDDSKNFGMKDRTPSEKLLLLEEMLKLFTLDDTASIEELTDAIASSWNTSDLSELTKFLIERNKAYPPSISSQPSRPSAGKVDPSHYPGLVNASQNCWLISVLQCLSSDPPSQLEIAYRTFARYKLTSENAEDKRWAQVLLDQLNQFKQDQSDRVNQSTTDAQQIRLAFHHFFRDGHGEPMFSESEFRPEDAHEAISQIMKGYEEALKAQNALGELPSAYREVVVTREYTPTEKISDADPAKLAKTREKPDDPTSPYTIIGPEDTSIKKKTDFEIFLPLQGARTRNPDELLLSHFVKAGSQDELANYLGADDKLHEYRLSKERAQFTTPPDELLITVERFGNDPATGATHKITDDVPFTRYLTLPEEATVSGEQITMELDYFIVHSGELNGGHYVNYKKIDGRWIMFNDDHPREVLTDAQIDIALKQSYIHHYKRIEPAAIAALKDAESSVVVSDPVASEPSLPSVPSEPLILQASPPHPPVPTTAKLLFNLLADEFGANSELQGVSMGQILSYVTEYIKSQNSLATTDHTAKESILYELTMAHTIYSQMERSIEDDGLSRVITEALTADKPFIIPGGWIGSPFGHAVYYEVIPQSNGRVNFRIFNTGEGITYHQSTRVGIKEKVVFIEWQGISKEKIQDPHFARIIKEMATRIEGRHPKLSWSFISTKYKAQDIYQGLKAFLRPTSIAHQHDAPLMQPQRAGTCACRALFAFLKSKLSIDEYQRLKLDLRIQALTGFISIRSKAKVSRVDYQLTSKATEKLSRRVNDLFAKRVIQIGSLITAERQLAHAQAWLKEHRIQVPDLTIDQAAIAPINNPVTLSGLPNIATSIAVVDGMPSDQTPVSNIMSEIFTYRADRPYYRLDNPPTFIANIQSVCDILTKMYEKKEYSGVHFAIVDLIQQIPTKRDFFSHLPKKIEEIECAINALGTLSELFFKSCYRIQNSSPNFTEKKYTLTKLVFTQFKLVELLGPIHLFDIRFVQDSNPYEQRLDPKIVKGIEDIEKDYFSNPVFPEISIVNGKTLAFFSRRDEPFILFLQRRFPKIYESLKSALTAEDPEFGSKTPSEKELLMFNSPLLPHWLQSIKKSYICLCHFRTFPIVPLKDPFVCLDFQYQNEGKRTTISLQGITDDNYKHQPWSGIQAPIQNPMIDDLIGLLRLPGDRSEKLLYSTSGNKDSNRYLAFMVKWSEQFPANDLKELLHIFTSRSHWLIEALDYFTQHRKNLSDIDYQHLFQIACFYFKSVEQIPIFRSQISDFLKNQITLRREEDDIKTKVFLQRMGRYFKHHGCTVPDETAHLLQLLEQPKTTAEEKSLIYAELAAPLSEKFTLNAEESTLLLKAKAWIEHAPISLHWKDPQTFYDLEKAMTRHSESLMKLMPEDNSPNYDLLNSIYSLINKKEAPPDLTWERINSSGMKPRFKSNQNDFYDPMSGRFTTIGLEAHLPIEIRNHLTFKELFPDQHRGTVRSNDAYEFKRGETTVLVKKSETGLIIEQCKDGSWSRFIPREEFSTSSHRGSGTNPLESRYLSDNYNVWQSKTPTTPPTPGEASADSASKATVADPVDSRILTFYDKKTDKKSYQATYLNGSITSVTRLSDGATLRKSSKLLAHIENPSYIQEWYKGEKLIEIELPRFKLCFNLDDKGFFCKELPGFYLCNGENSSAIGSCKYGLFLRNIEGYTCILLPNQQLQAPFREKESLEPKFQRNQALRIGESVNFTYFTYDLLSNGYLKSSSKEGYFYLIQTLAVHQEYKQAAYYLRTYGEKVSAYSQKEIDTLQAIANVKEVTGDESGEQVAIALYASYLLATNIIKNSDALRALPKLYTEYLSRLRNVTALRLSKGEELHLLKSLLPEPLNEKFTDRLSELEGTSRIKGSIIPESNPSADTTIEPDLLDYLKTYYECEQLPANFENKILLTRSGDFIRENLLEIIKIALHPTPNQRKWLETACIFTKATDRKNASLSLLLEIILKNPDHFTTPPENSYSLEAQAQKFSDWLSVTTTTAQRLEALQTPSESANTVASPTSTSDVSTAAATTPYTDHPPIQIPLRDFIFTPDAMPPLSEQESVSTWTTPTKQTATVDADLLGFLSSQKSVDPVEIAEWTRLRSDAEALSQKAPKTVYRLNKKIPEIISTLKGKQSAVLSEIYDLQRQMLQIGATLPTDETEKAVFLLNKRGKIFDEITIHDIFISLALKDPRRLLEKNPYLSQDNLNKLYALAALYLQNVSQWSQLYRCLDLCDKISSDSTEELIQQFCEQLLDKRCYDMREHPEYLVFEYYAGLTMRQDQVSKLQDFLEGGSENPVMEMIMGSGKSKVLLPLLGLLRANGKELSMVVVPQPLFESVSSDTQEILQAAFSTSLKTCPFDRNSTFTKRSLEEIKTSLETVITKKQSLIMTSKSIQSLILKFILCANDLYQEDKEESEELTLMTSIIALLQKACNPLIDEADTVLNVRHEVSFSLGGRKPIKEDEIQLIDTIYELLYSNPELKRIARLESDPNPDAEAPPLSETVYHRDLKQPLAIHLLDQLIRQKKLTNDDNREALLAYLCRDENEAKKAMAKAFFDHQSPDTQNLLALAAEEICSLLPETLLKTSDEKYGLDKGVIAIPYAAANTPSHGSLFSNPYITMNYTYQIHTKNGIREDTLIQLIKNLKKEADFQMLHEGIELIETDAYKRFCLLKGSLAIPFTNNLHPIDLQNLLAQINRNMAIRQQLIQKVFLPQMNLFEEKLACNPINLAALFSKVSGFTGTLWNAGSMHKRLKALPEAGTDAKTLNILIQKCSGPALIIHKMTGSSMFQDLGASVGPYDALIDAGGYFKEGGNLFIARQMAVAHGKSVVFYNVEGVQTITDGTTEIPLGTSPVTQDERLTFYDQSHTTGSDIKQKGGALGLVTIGRGMLLRDLLQSVWRLRGLERGQSLKFVIDDEVASIIRAQLGLERDAEIGFKEILQFVVQNQASQQADDNFKGFKQQLDNLSQNLLLEIMTDPKYSQAQKKQVFLYLRPNWIKPANLTPAELFGTPAFERESDRVLEEESQKCVAKLNAIGQKFTFLQERVDSLKAEIEEIKKRAKSSVRTKVISPQSDTHGTVELEVMSQLETDVDMEMATEIDNAAEKMELPGCYQRIWAQFSGPPTQESTRTIPLFPIASQMGNEPTLDKYKDLFEGISISLNVLEWKQEADGRIHQLRLLGAHRTPFHHLLVDGDKVTLFSQIEDITTDRNYFNLTLGFADPDRPLSKVAFEKIVKLKFLNGQSTFTKAELDFLENWIKDGGIPRMWDLYSKHILKYQPDKRVAFSGSNLEKLFKELKKSEST